MLLVVVDSLRFDVTTLAYPRDVAPWIRGFASRATVYERAYSLSSATARSVAGLFAGRYPAEMIRSGWFFTTWYPENLMLAERLARAGHRSLAVLAHAYFFPSSGLAQGFDDWRVLPGTFLGNTTATNVTSRRITELAMERLSDPQNFEQAGGRRFFAYVHYVDPHQPYLVHAGRTSYGHRPRDRYDQEVSFTDEHAGRLVDWALRQSWGDRTAVIVTSDHGECFGEHGHLKHGYELWEELVHVPLLIRLPGAPPRRIEAARSHIDLAATILELMRVPATPALRGTSLVGELRGAPAETRPVVIDQPRDELEDRRRALIEWPLKLIVAGDDRRRLLFDIEADPGERHELSAREPEKLRRMQRRLAELGEGIPLEPIRGDLVPLAEAPPGRRW